MTNNAAGTDARVLASFGFSALAFALFGWIDLGILLYATNAGIKAYLMSALGGIVLSGLAYRRCRVWWTPSACSPAVSRLSAFDLIGSALVLVMAGWVLASSMRTGFVTPAVIGAAVLCFLPWYRSEFCRRYFFASQALLIAGWIPVLLTPASLQYPFLFPASTCAIWALAAGLTLVTLFK